MAYLKTFAFDAFATSAFMLEPDEIEDQTSSSDNPSAGKV